MRRNLERKQIFGQVIYFCFFTNNSLNIYLTDNIFTVENYMHLKKKFAKEDINNFKKMLEIPEEIDYL